MSLSYQPVGPLTSFALSLAFWAAILSLQEREGPIAALAWYLALINLLLGAFNLLPAFPLDGGRVLRSIVWALTGSLPKATNLASFIGQGFGLLLILAGAIEVFGGSFWEGLWIALIGWFLHGSAGASRREVSLSADAIGVLVKEVMDAGPVTIAPDRSISDAVYLEAKCPVPRETRDQLAHYSKEFETLVRESRCQLPLRTSS